MHTTTSFSPFYIVYGFNHLTPLDLMHLSINEMSSLHGHWKSELVKSIHGKVQPQIEQKNENFASQSNTGKGHVIFERENNVWVYMCKEKFSAYRRNKLHPWADGLFQILEKINYNAYKVDHPCKYNISATFNVSNLSSFDADDNSRLNPFEERWNDGHHVRLSLKDPMQVSDKPIIRSRSKKIKEAMQRLLQFT